MGRFGMILALGLFAAAPALTQVRTVDPNAAGGMAATSAPATAAPAPEDDSADTAPPTLARAAPEPAPAAVSPPNDGAAPAKPPAEIAARHMAGNDTYTEKDVLTAADGVFGKGAADLARLIEKIFKDQGQPSAYIAGREVGGAVVVGVRYGSGTMFHKIEGERKVYWTGPSIGFDLGANGAKTFVLVYNLYDSQDLYKRFAAAEGSVYAIGGFTASYLRRGNIVVIPIRLGLGVRLGANVGYMHFTQKSKWAPF